ncbi:B-cell scaffold protein with ankyrin repeats-like isoform X2 [Heptranchias perlo]|uniref:B-cell scaffold protein with ankyrin repeats-like isoform X2 n=1 Tax=Heptranchias perlo TaxID=212740 RepID=UPI00355992C6
MKRSEIPSTDLVILFEEEAEEWSTYLKQIFLEQLNPQSICCYRVACSMDLKTAAPNLASYRCKLLILTVGFLTTLTTPKRIHLSKILQPPDEVVILLCGVPNSDELYKLVPVARGGWEISSEQDPQEYLSVVISIVKSGASEQLEAPAEDQTSEEDSPSEDVLSDSLIEYGVGELQQQVGPREDPVGAPAVSSAVRLPVQVIPNRIQCKSPTEIYVLLKDGMSFGEDPEVEFLTSTERVKSQAALWNSQTLCVKALDFPPGPVTMNLYCGGVITAKADLLYYTVMEEIGRLLLRAADPMEFICQAFQINSRNQLDQLLSRSLQNSLPPSGFGAFQTFGPGNSSESNSLYHDHEFPTLLHFAAKNGLQNLTTLLLKCPGAAQACAVLNARGENPSELAERNGFQQVRELIDKFTLNCCSERVYNRWARSNGYPALKDQVSTERPENQWPETFQSNYGIHNHQRVEGEKEESIYEMMAQVDSSKACSKMKEDEEDEEAEENPYTLTLDDEDPYDLILPESSSNTEVKKDNMANIVKRPPAPTPRPTTLQCVDNNTPFIAQVFQQKTGRGADDKLYAAPKRAARPKVDESPVYDTFEAEHNPGQRQLIHLQEMVKKGLLTVDGAQEKFKLWQTEQKNQDAVQQEKLRKFRENIIKDRHVEDGLYDKIKIVHLSDDANTKGDDIAAARGQAATKSTGPYAKLANTK